MHLKQKPNELIRYPGTASTLIAIPVLNEYGYVDDVLDAVSRYADSILVVNDGSTDGTLGLLEKYNFIKIISHQTNEGYGQSLIDAFNYAYEHNFDWLITIDCDHQHEPSYIPHFYSEIEKNDVDIISGSRYLYSIDSGSIRPPNDRIVINKKITRILNKNLKIKITDSFCGFKAYRVKSIIRLKLTEKGYGFPLQLWIRASQASLKIREIPVSLIYHDPKRNFGGLLESARTRYDYYMEIIQSELKQDVYKNNAKSNCS